MQSIIMCIIITISIYKLAIIEVSGISGKINKGLLQMYFESEQDSGGEPFAVKECEFISSGCAYVIFHQSHGRYNVVMLYN